MLPDPKTSALLKPLLRHLPWALPHLAPKGSFHPIFPLDLMAPASFITVTQTATKAAQDNTFLGQRPDATGAALLQGERGRWGRQRITSPPRVNRH